MIRRRWYRCFGSISILSPVDVFTYEEAVESVGWVTDYLVKQIG